jgi:hypothetical protein
MRVTSIAFEEIAGQLHLEQLPPDVLEDLSQIRTELNALSQEISEEARVLDVRREAAETRLR